jgi:hypothetical protein
MVARKSPFWAGHRNRVEGGAVLTESGGLLCVVVTVTTAAPPWNACLPRWIGSSCGLKLRAPRVG